MDEIMELNVSSGERKKYKGVRRRKWGRWVSEIRLPHSRDRIWLGSYDTPEKAARAFDAAYICLRGPGSGADGLINFPHSPPPAVAGRTTDPDEVYAAAVSHANRAAADEVPSRDATTEPSSEAARDGGAPPVVEAAVAAAVAPPLQVGGGSSDEWPSSRLVADDLPPLYSPMYYLPPPDDIINMEENESASCCCCPGLWSFDSSECPARSGRR